MSACSDCTTAARQEWHGFAAACKGCDARALFRVFLARGERGRRYRQACEMLGVTDVEVRRWAPQEGQA